MDEKTSDGRTTFSRIKGTKVYDAEGDVFGHVSDIELNQATLSPTHLIVHKGFFGEYVKINLKYIDRITRDKIQLWISPVKNLVGNGVFDSEGTEMGIIKEAEKGKDGNLEYIRVETRFLRTRDEEEELETYIAPMIPFEDMSITLPSAPIQGGSMATHMDLNMEEIIVHAEDIISIHNDRVILKNKKEDYIKK